MKKLKRIISISFLSLSLLALSFGTSAQGFYQGCDGQQSPFSMEGGCMYWFGHQICDTGIDPFGSESEGICWVLQTWL